MEGAAALGGCTPRFRELLEQLAQEHEGELARLRQELAAVKSKASGPLEFLEETPVAADASDSEDLARAPTTSGATHVFAAGIEETCEHDRLDSHKSQMAVVLELKGVWQEVTRGSQCDMVRMECTQELRVKEIERLRGSRETSTDSVLFPMHTNPNSCCPANPNASWRLYWDCAGLLLVTYDMIVIPLQVFAIPESTFSVVMDMGTLLFWTTDMAMAFNLGFYKDGRLVMSHPKIIANYVKSWFAIDLLVVLPEWLVLVVFRAAQDAGGISRLLRGARAIRVLRLLRIMKLQRVVNHLYDMIDNEYSFIVAELIKMMCMIITLNHLIACGWFLAARLTISMGEPSWTTWTQNYMESSYAYQYTTCLHWSLTQFTPASVDIVARGMIERLYSIAVLLFALITFSSIVGTVTSSMTIIRQMKSNRQKQFWMLRRYLKQKHVSKDLNNRMTRFLEHRCASTEKSIARSKVALLDLISDQLASELALEMHSPCLREHPFFYHLSQNMKGVAFRICHSAVKILNFAADDIVFTAGEEAKQVLVVKGGNLSYFPRDLVRLEPALHMGDWLGEVLLWTTSWRYRGMCSCLNPCELLGLNVEKVVEAMSAHPSTWTFARIFGMQFIAYLGGILTSEWTDVMRDTGLYLRAIQNAEQEMQKVSSAACLDGQGQEEEARDKDQDSVISVSEWVATAQDPEDNAHEAPADPQHPNGVLHDGNTQDSTAPARGAWALPVVSCAIQCFPFSSRFTPAAPVGLVPT